MELIITGGRTITDETAEFYAGLNKLSQKLNHHLKRQMMIDFYEIAELVDDEIMLLSDLYAKIKYQDYFEYLETREEFIYMWE